MRIYQLAPDLFSPPSKHVSTTRWHILSQNCAPSSHPELEGSQTIVVFALGGSLSRAACCITPLLFTIASYLRFCQFEFCFYDLNQIILAYFLNVFKKSLTGEA